MAPVLLAADLHLASDRPAMADRFRRFLANEARAASALYLLGDVFEYWVGDDDADDPLYASVLADLAALARAGIEVYFLRGNRDFLFGPAAAERSGIRLLAEPALIDLDGERTLLMHGDTLCTDDRSYQRYRAIARNGIVQRAFLALPRSARRAFAQGLRHTSDAHTQRKQPTIMDVNAAAVEAALRAHGYPRLIHGHTHRPARHEHLVDGRACVRWVLPDWYERGGYLRSEGRDFQVISLET
jgi:UDP-2,3-diacylglucosamine hydrolase